MKRKKNSNKSILLGDNSDYVIVPDSDDWKFDTNEFTSCGFIYKNKKGKIIISNIC
jgi:hypothetical protein